MKTKQIKDTVSIEKRCKHKWKIRELPIEGASNFVRFFFVCICEKCLERRFV